MTLPVPALMLREVYALTPEMLRRRGVKFLMMDLDNTLSPYHIHEADGRLRAWVEDMKRGGIELFILSNNHGSRPARFAAQLNLDYVNRAKKPRTAVALRIVQERGYTPAETALIGDQIYTDILCAVRCGFTGICVRPICMTRNPLLALRYAAEFPFRLAYKGEEE